MTNQQSQYPDEDLDRTDQLPILQGTLPEDDIEDDAVRMDHTAVLPGSASFAAGATDFVRSSSVDLPSLAESVRSVEERIARQNAEYEALTRAHERAREAETTAVARAHALAVDLASVRSALESEQMRSREMDRTLAERSAAMEAARVRAEDALRESDRHQGESLTLRDSLAARESTIAQVLHSLGERDAQLAALQSEHAKIVPVLEAKSKSTSQLEAELQSSRAQVNALAQDLKAGRDAAAALNLEFTRSESQVNAARSELAIAKTQAASYLELLRTREWRRGFDQNMFREMDAQVGAANAGHGALESERSRLHGRVVELEAKLAAQLAAAETERSHLTAALAARERTIAETHERGSAEEQRIAELLEAAQLREAEHATQIAGLRGEQAAQIARLQSEADTHEQEMAVLMAHLQEARRPIQSIEADVKRLTEALTAKTAAFQHLEEENRNLRGALERTRGQLEEREFLIRRLERSESNNANVLGRIQTSIERLGAGAATLGTGAAAAPATEWSAELIRIDGERPVTHVLSRRTRIGRAAGCELQIDSGSVSRHHALVVVSPRETVIENLNSTNGVLVNGRKVSRQPLSDGDAVTIGEVQFRYLARPITHPAEPKPAEPVA
ncbi:MAG TPA: FHA domain-containing protein [Steroidobacteraceae bacterium]|nr:FHA domain-containing protein [Steroidobacteraceae bacterium]